MFPTNAKNSRPKALQVGGPWGILIPFNLSRFQVSSKGYRGSRVLASKRLRLFNDQVCLVSLARRQVALALDQPQALCRHCRNSLSEIDNLLNQIITGQADETALAALTSACTALKKNGADHLGRGMANFILSALERFPEEFRLHAVNKFCPARACPRLLAAPCHQACPAHIDIPTYLALAAQGRYQEAWEVMRRDNPFPWVCGLICPHPCEQVCVRGRLDEAINIRYLKAFISEWVLAHGNFSPPQPAPANGRKAAVIGSGPAGLTCAYYLALKGYGVTVFEALPQSGGLLVAGIPEYRLPREVVGKEIELVRALGVEIRTGVTAGRDFSLDDLRRQGYAAIFLGIGAHLGYKLKIEGETDFPQVYDALTFLRNIYLGEKTRPGDRVVVIGGGNAAMDAARTCIRLGCREVHLAYRRSREEMPAHPEEVAQALEEGVQIHFLAIPIKIGGENGGVEYLECLQAELGPADASGRRRPIPIAGSNFRIPADAVIAAIGQQPDLCPFPEPPVATTRWCTIITQPPGARSNVPDIFAGGDAVTGPATVVEAIAAGKQAAAEIDHFLSGAPGPPPVVRPARRGREPFQVIPAPEKIAARRAPVPMLDLESRRTTFAPEELSLTPDQAREEARRCLRCDVCIRCGACEQVCRDSVQVEALAFSPLSGDERLLTDYPRAAARCIACGACALACPTQAIDYLEGPDFREVRLCGTVLNHLEAPKCPGCGATLAPSRYLDYVTSRSDALMGKQVLRRWCPRCAREKRAANFVKL